MKYPDRQRKTIGIGVIGTKSWLRLSHRREPTPLSPPPLPLSAGIPATVAPQVRRQYSPRIRTAASATSHSGRSGYTTVLMVRPVAGGFYACASFEPRLCQSELARQRWN